MQGWVVAGTVSSLAPFASPIAADVFYVLCGTLMTFISTTLAHIALTGLRFFAFFVPAGVPFLFAPLLTMVDFVTHFARFISLSVRILANITAGHALMKIILGFACDFFSVLSIFSILGVLPAILLFILMALETFIAFLQGYIFALLNGSYQSEISA
jgi:ATP synthase subunit 6